MPRTKERVILSVHWTDICLELKKAGVRTGRAKEGWCENF